MSDTKHLLEQVLRLRKLAYTYDPKTKDLVETQVAPDAFIREDSPDVVRVSAEDGHGWANYYQERGDTIHPTLTTFAENRGMFWEWENPGCIVLYR
jgi:hypothetical protein